MGSVKGTLVLAGVSASLAAAAARSSGGRTRYAPLASTGSTLNGESLPFAMMGFTGTGGAVGLWGESRRSFSPLVAAVAGSFADPLALLFFPLFDDFHHSVLNIIFQACQFHLLWVKLVYLTLRRRHLVQY